MFRSQPPDGAAAPARRSARMTAPASEVASTTFWAMRCWARTLPPSTIVATRAMDARMTLIITTITSSDWRCTERGLTDIIGSSGRARGGGAGWSWEDTLDRHLGGLAHREVVDEHAHERRRDRVVVRHRHRGDAADVEGRRAGHGRARRRVIVDADVRGREAERGPRCDGAAAERPVRLERVLDRSRGVAVRDLRDLVHRGHPHGLPCCVGERVVGKHGAPDLEEPDDEQDDDRDHEGKLDEALAPTATARCRASRASRGPHPATDHGAWLRTVTPLAHRTVLPTVRLCHWIRYCGGTSGEKITDPVKPASDQFSWALLDWTLSRLITVQVGGVGTGVGVGIGVGVGVGVGVAPGAAVGSVVAVGPAVGVGPAVSVGAGDAVGASEAAGTPWMLPFRTGNADDALTGIGLPVRMPMSGVMRLKLQWSSTTAGAPMFVPFGNAGAGIGTGIEQLMSVASVVTRRVYSAWTGLLYGRVHAVGFIAA